MNNYEVEACVLADWLKKDKRFYRAEDGVEVNVQRRLYFLIFERGFSQEEATYLKLV